MNLFLYTSVSVLALLSYVASYSGIHLLPYLYILTWIVIWKVFSIKKAMYFYLAVLLIDGDISKFGNEENQSYITIYTEYIFGKSLFVFWTIFNFIILMGFYIKKHSFKVNKFLIPFVWIFFISLFMGIPNFVLNPTSFISDTAYFINFFVGFLIAWLFINEEKDVKYFFLILSIVLLIKTIIISFDSYYMSLTGFFNVYAIESTAYLYPILLVYSFLSLQNKKLFSIISISLIFLLMMITASRGRIMIAALALLYSNIASKKFHYYIIIVLLVVIVFSIVSMLNQDVANYLMWKINTFLPDSTGYNKVESMSSMVRLIELKNIISMHLDKVYTLFVGTGFGGYFTSEYFSYPFSLFNTSSYPDIWISNDQFFKPHSSLLFILLKFGLVGFLLIYGTVVYLSFWVMTKIQKSKCSLNYKNIIISLTSFLPFLFLVNFTSKLQIFSGVFFGILLMFYKTNRYKQKNNLGEAE